MKGLILSGGKGTRLRPLTYTSAKQLVPVANKPILFYGIEALVAADIKEIAIVVGDTKTAIQNAVGDGSHWGAQITYIEQDAPRGLAHAVMISESFLKDEPFVMYLGDNLLAQGIRPFVKEFKINKPAAQILLTRVKNPSQFGVAELTDNRVIRLSEKPSEPKTDLALVGVYLFGSQIFDSVKRIKPSSRNELEITDAIQDLIDHNLTVRPHIVKGWWKDTGRIEDLLEANRLILETITPRNDGAVDGASSIEGKVIVEKDALIRSSVIRGPAIIGSATVLENAYIGPFTSIMKNSEIRGSEIEHSIVLEKAVITNLSNRIVDSLIGKNVRIYRQPMKPSAYRFMLGDNSEIGIRW